MLKKFPVTSGSGNEYLVKISESSYFEDSVDVKVYRKGKFFSRKLFEIPFDEEARQYDYTAMAISAVNNYEQGERYKHIQLMMKQYRIKEFEEWDGNC
ncbi:hypothetical protein [Bacillus chungangensis]|uniref:Uncharacterized protein n=1 Tax=Bacillus chungangensis TaxID=587633 RepID=A0ABT9WMI8_9BACI|nr:hypothetical protein [Bacillus chungangensis]MDQ0174447.1 hypothetical protein [Bacillus chungangensis]